MNASGDDGVVGKGLQGGSLGLIGSVIMGVAAVAPAITSTASFGPTAIAAGAKMPAVITLGAIPMILVALGYRELNRALPDAGTTFTWVSRAFGPHLGWIAGWVLIVAMALGYSNAAAIGVEFLFLALSQAFDQPWLAMMKDNPAINLLSCLAILSTCGWIAYRGLMTTQAVQYVLVGFQLVVLAMFLLIVLFAPANAMGGAKFAVSGDWFNPLNGLTAAGAATGVSLAVYMFWGWEITLTLNEETKGAGSTPGLAAWLTVVSTIALYLLLAIACLVYVGAGQEGMGLTSPDVQSNVFLVLAQPAFGPFAILFSIATIFSAVACVQSTIMCPARTLLAMGVYGAMPPAMGKVGRHHTPGMAILLSTLASWAAYAAVSLTSENVLGDTVTALGILVCFYLSLTALACVWYFRDTWFASARNFVLRLLFPLLGGISMGVLFIKTIVDSADPAYGSGSRIGSVGLVCVIGLGLILVGAMIMLFMHWRMPGFFGTRPTKHENDQREMLVPPSAI